MKKLNFLSKLLKEKRIELVETSEEIRKRFNELKKKKFDGDNRGK
jgi:hypothetical protein